MLIPDIFKDYSIKPNGILHVGAHRCEERRLYANSAGCGDSDVLWVEAVPEYAEIARKDFPDARIVQAIVSDTEEEVDFIVTNNGMSSSFLELKEHKKEHPTIVEVKRFKAKTTTLYDILSAQPDSKKFDFICLDIQGAELRAIKGLGSKLKQFNYIVTEVNEREMYAKCPLLPELEWWLSGEGFALEKVHMTEHGWGDALFKRTKP
jgi:FkbM family methyltransferase